MPDTVRTLAALQTLLADNVAGDISAQDVRDFLVSAFPPEPQVARVETTESTSSATFVDLATAGPAVTVTVGSSGILIVGIGAEAFNDTLGAGFMTSYALSGATTQAADDLRSFSGYSPAANQSWGGTRVSVQTGLAAGATTVTAKYRRLGGGTANFKEREIWAIAWGGVF